MIGALLEFNGEVIDIRIAGANIYFRTASSGGYAPITGLGLNKEGVLKEFPDLKDKLDWRDIALERFKEKLKSFTNENQAMDYVIEDLKKFGYKPLVKQRAGFRPEKIQ